MKKLAIIIIGAAVLSFKSFAQDLHFAQSSQTPLFINPGAAGVFDGWERATINHRNQWLGAQTQFMTTAISADVNIGKSSRNDKAHLGLGIMFFNDIGGDSNFGNQTGSLTLSGILPMGSSGHILSAGVQGGFGSRKADLSGVTFMNQWDGSTFNQTINSGEQNTLNTFTYADASAGIYYVFDGGKSSFSRNNDFKFKLGVAGFHLNKPKMKYIDGSSDYLHRKYVGNIGVESDFVGSPIAIEGNFVQFVQGGHYESLLGFIMKYRFKNATKITGNIQDAFIGIGSYVRFKDAVIPTVVIDWKGFHFGISYDVTTSELRKANSGGSLEFSLTYKNLDHSLFKTRGRKF
jgi:type IX secretion system PorP/SprF family membrane protein